jgi:hypothetical protein
MKKDSTEQKNNFIRFTSRDGLECFVSYKTYPDGHDEGYGYAVSRHSVTHGISFIAPTGMDRYTMETVAFRDEGKKVHAVGLFKIEPPIPLSDFLQTSSQQFGFRRVVARLKEAFNHAFTKYVGMMHTMRSDSDDMDAPHPDLERRFASKERDQDPDILPMRKSSLEDFPLDNWDLYKGIRDYARELRAERDGKPSVFKFEELVKAKAEEEKKTTPETGVNL